MEAQEMKEILLIDDSAEDAMLVERTIAKHMPGRFNITHKTTMAEAETYLTENEENISLILLDMTLPDTTDGRDTFTRIKLHATDIPIVVLTGLEDHALALSLVKGGAEDFVNKGKIHEKPELLRDVLEFAATRHELVQTNTKQYEEKIKAKDEVITWMGGGYSVKNDDTKKEIQ